MTDDRPEGWSLSVSAAAWLALLLQAGPSGVQELCVARPQGFGAGPAAFAAAWAAAVPGRMLLQWVLMTLAMMPPLAIPLIRHVAARSFAERRARATVGFLAGAVLAWLLAGLAALPLIELVPASWRASPAPAASAFLLAAAWQLTPFKRRALRVCHRTVPLAALGWRADRDCARFGFGYGRACVASCWAMMLASMLVTHSFGSALWIQGVALAERHSPRAGPWVSAILLAGWGVVEAVPRLLAGQT